MIHFVLTLAALVSLAAAIYLTVRMRQTARYYEEKISAAGALYALGVLWLEAGTSFQYVRGAMAVGWQAYDKWLYPADASLGYQLMLGFGLAFVWLVGFYLRGKARGELPSHATGEL